MAYLVERDVVEEQRKVVDCDGSGSARAAVSRSTSGRAASPVAGGRRRTAEAGDLRDPHELSAVSIGATGGVRRARTLRMMSFQSALTVVMLNLAGGGRLAQHRPTGSSSSTLEARTRRTYFGITKRPNRCDTASRSTAIDSWAKRKKMGIADLTSTCARNGQGKEGDEKARQPAMRGSPACEQLSPGRTNLLAVTICRSARAELDVSLRSGTTAEPQGGRQLEGRAASSTRPGRPASISSSRWDVRRCRRGGRTTR